MIFPESKSCRCPCNLGSAGQAGIGELHERGGDSSFACHGWHRKPGDLCNHPRYFVVVCYAWEERPGLPSYSSFIGIDSNLVRYTLTFPGDFHQQALVIELHSFYDCRGFTAIAEAHMVDDCVFSVPVTKTSRMRRSWFNRWHLQDCRGVCLRARPTPLVRCSMGITWPWRWQWAFCSMAEAVPRSAVPRRLLQHLWCPCFPSFL